MTLRILVPWVLTIVTAAGGFLISLRQERLMKLSRVYLAYFATAGSVQLICWVIKPGHYGIVFWILELSHDILLCLLALEITSHLLPPRFVKFWAIAFLLIMIIGYVNSLPTTAPKVLLNLGVSSLFTGAWLLMLLVFFDVPWTREYGLVTAGVLAVIANDVLSSPYIRAGMNDWFVALIQLSPLPGLVLLTLAGRKATTIQGLESPQSCN